MQRPHPGAPPAALAIRDGEFTGRVWVLDRIGLFLRAGRGAVLMVVGKPGIGKTALAVRLTRIARGEVPAPQGVPDPVVHAAHFCRARDFAAIDATSVVEQVADQLSVTVPGFSEHRAAAVSGGSRQIRIDQRVRRAEPGANITAIRHMTLAERDPRWAFEALLRRPLAELRVAGRAPADVVVLIDGLDESVEGTASMAGKNLVDLLAAELAEPIPGVRWLLTTRAENVAARLADSIDQRIDLDCDAPAGIDDLRVYAEHRLAPVPAPGGQELARLIADMAGGNFLYAYHVTNDVLALSPAPASLASFPLPEGLAGVYREFLDRKIGLGDDWRHHYRPVMGALTQARGPGLTRDQLVTVTGLQPSKVDDTLRTCEPYLAGGSSTGLTIYHHSLRDYLRADGPHHIYPGEASAMILDRLAPGPAGRRRWDRADPHILKHGIHYAIDIGRVADLITDPGFLIHADPHLVLPALDSIEHSLPDNVDRSAPALPPSPVEQADRAGLAVAVYRTSAHTHGNQPSVARRQVLALDAARWGDHHLADCLETTPVAGHPLSPARIAWATGSGVNRAAGVLTGHEFGVTAVALGELDGRPIAVTGTGLGTTRIWDLTSRTPIGTPLTGPVGAVNAVALGKLDSRPIAVTGGWDGSVRIWDLTRCTPIGAPLTGHDGAVTAVAVGELDGRPIAVTGSSDKTARIWDLTSCTLIRHRGAERPPDRGHRRPLGPNGADLGPDQPRPNRRSAHRPHRPGDRAR
jgi:WD domain, G-beta repeat